MATRGSANSNSQSGMYLRFAWEITETNIGSNYDEIYWELTGQGGSAGYYIVSGPFYVTVGDSQYSATGRINMYPGTIVLNGRTKIYHNSDGKKNFSVSFSGAIYSYSVNSWGSGSWDLPDIPRKATITAAENFNDEGNPTITYSNLAGNNATTLQACISLTGAKDDVPYRNISKTGNSYTFNLTDAERKTLRVAAKNSNSINVTFYVKTVIGGNTFYSTSKKTMTIVNANPVIDSSLVSYKDVNPKTVGRTGDDQAAIRGYSNIQVTIPVAEAQKEATILKYRVQIGSVQKDADYSDRTITTQLDNIDSSIINIYAIDSRGNSTLATKAIAKYINYKALSEYISSAVATRTSGVSQEVTLDINGQYWNGGFKDPPSPEFNYIKKITYQYMKTEGDYIWHTGSTPIVFTTNKGNYTFSGTIAGDLAALGFDNEYSFYIKVIVEDQLSTTEIEYILQKASPNIALHRLGTSFGKPYDENEGGTVQIEGINIFKAIYPVGSIYMNMTLVDPAILFGGTWQRLKDTFLMAIGDRHAEGESGGAETHNHTTGDFTLQVQHIPSHSHTVNFEQVQYGGAGTTSLGTVSGGPYGGSGYVNNTGGGEAHNHGNTGNASSLPPYITVYMWQRIS